MDAFVTDLFYLFIPPGGLKYEKNKNLKLRDINYPLGNSMRN